MGSSLRLIDEPPCCRSPCSWPDALLASVGGAGAGVGAGAGGGGGGAAGGGAGVAVEEEDPVAGRFAHSARARCHHLRRASPTLTAAQALRARCFPRSLRSLRRRRSACAAVSGLLSPPACRSAAPREPLASVAGLPAACRALA